jgi:CDP-diacylglycerol--inositol 3-phosphatidyltransferase
MECGSDGDGSVSYSLVVQKKETANQDSSRANKIGSFWPGVLFASSSPVMLYKQVVNVVQLVQASRWIAQGDIEARRKERRSS